jgi:hypothetical protein
MTDPFPEVYEDHRRPEPPSTVPYISDCRLVKSPRNHIIEMWIQQGRGGAESPFCIYIFSTSEKDSDKARLEHVEMKYDYNTDWVERALRFYEPDHIYQVSLPDHTLPYCYPALATQSSKLEFSDENTLNKRLRACGRID